MSRVAVAARDVVLRDGTTMRLRPPRRDDADRVIATVKLALDAMRRAARTSTRDWS